MSLCCSAKESFCTRLFASLFSRSSVISFAVATSLSRIFNCSLKLSFSPSATLSVCFNSSTSWWGCEGFLDFLAASSFSSNACFWLTSDCFSSRASFRQAWRVCTSVTADPERFLGRKCLGEGCGEAESARCSCEELQIWVKSGLLDTLVSAPATFPVGASSESFPELCLFPRLNKAFL